MDAPDEMVEAVARIAPKPDGNGEHFVEMVLGGNRHCAWLRGSPRLIAALAEVIARDAKVREVVTKVDRGVIGEHPCAGPCVGCGAGPDESCHGDCRCDNGEDCWPAVLIEADRELLRRITALYPEAGK